MNSATGSESTPTRRIWTGVNRPHVATSGSARTISDTNWPKRPTALIPATALRPTCAITARNYVVRCYDATLYDESEVADETSAGHLLQRSVLQRNVGHAAKLASAFPTSPSRSRLSARSRPWRASAARIACRIHQTA